MSTKLTKKTPVGSEASQGASRSNGTVMCQRIEDGATSLAMRTAIVFAGLLNLTNMPCSVHVHLCHDMMTSSLASDSDKYKTFVITNITYFHMDDHKKQVF